MTNREIKKILIDKGVTHLYHANTVATACTFIENKGLLSRGTVNDLGLYQTGQASDDSDKDFDVFYDIFFDSVDIHQRSKRINNYGPVVFVYSIDILDVLPPDCIRITKDNPMYWTLSMKDEDKYFLTEDELRFFYQRGKFNQHLTLRNQTSPIPFDYLEKIILDDPGVEDTRFFDDAYQHLQDLIDDYAPGIPLEVRQCPPSCSCREQYMSYKAGYIYYRFHFK